MTNYNKSLGSKDCQAGKPDVDDNDTPRQAGKPDVRTYYERHLPHQVPTGFPIFLNWNLKGSLPQRVVTELEHERKRLAKEPRRFGETDRQRGIRHDKLLFAKRDRYLDTTRQGPMHLKDPRAAQIVVDSLVWGIPERYDLYAYVAMVNHIHALFTPKVDLKIITQGMKGYTSYRINEIQNARGRILWQDESYDHWARDEEELHRIIAYIENNPVAAGMCQRPEDWHWSSAAWRTKLDWKAGETFRPQWKGIVSTSGFPA
jgi:REP element-mobilizing transposase RayT